MQDTLIEEVEGLDTVPNVKKQHNVSPTVAPAAMVAGDAEGAQMWKLVQSWIDTVAFRQTAAATGSGGQAVWQCMGYVLVSSAHAVAAQQPHA